MATLNHPGTDRLALARFSVQIARDLPEPGLRANHAPEAGDPAPSPGMMMATQ